MSALKHKESQIGWVVIGIMIPTIIFLFLLYYFQWGDHPLPLVPFIFLALLFIVIMALFYKLTIEVHSPYIILRYGIGLIKIRLTIDELISTKVIKTPWYYGLGIRITPKGMLYNIHGSKAVEIEYLENGRIKMVMIGTLQHEKLKRIIDMNFKSGG